MKQLTGNMSSVVKGMDSALKHMDINKISEVMEKFERQFENLDVQTNVMEGAIQSSVAVFEGEDLIDVRLSKSD